MSSASPDKPTAANRPTNITLDSALIADAKMLGINLSRAAEQGIVAAVRQKRAELWLAENRAALDSSKAYVETHGLPLSRFRQF